MENWIEQKKLDGDESEYCSLGKLKWRFTWSSLTVDVSTHIEIENIQAFFAWQKKHEKNVKCLMMKRFSVHSVKYAENGIITCSKLKCSEYVLNHVVKR